jgi:hypothetical protein
MKRSDIEVFGQPGTMVRIDGQMYELHSIVSYVTASGAADKVAYWSAICAEPECFEPIATAELVGKLPRRRHCDAHSHAGGSGQAEVCWPPPQKRFR